MEFDEQPPAGEQRQSVTLDITTPDEAECKWWDLYPVTPLQVTLSKLMGNFHFGSIYTRTKILVV